MPDTPAFSRKTPDEVELRGMMPRRVIDVLDAVSGARRMARNELALEVLSKWADEQEHIAMVIQRVVRSNPPVAESDGTLNP